MAGRLHVLIIGVSEYPNLPDPGQPIPVAALGMQRLKSPAISAYRLYEWLHPTLKDGEEPPLKLGHCSLLLNPSAEELKDQALATAAAENKFQPCTLENVIEAADAWRQAASANPDDMTWFYFAGHGVQRSKNDAVLLLQDFGKAAGGALRHAIDVNTLFNGMAPAPSQPNIARSQLYFIDACRILPEEFKKVEGQDPTQVFKVELSGEDDRRAPIYFASISGEKAMGFRGKPSAFSQSLLKCLGGSAGREVDDADGNTSWQITSQGITDAMTVLFEDLKALGIDQTLAMGGQPSNFPVCKSGRPEVEVLIDINPTDAWPHPTITITDPLDGQATVLRLNRAPPHALSCPAGMYRFEVTVPPDQPQLVSSKPSMRNLVSPLHRFIGKVVR